MSLPARKRVTIGNNPIKRLWVPRFHELSDGRCTFQARENAYYRLRHTLALGNGDSASFEQGSAAAAFEPDDLSKAAFLTTIQNVTDGKTRDCTLMIPTGPEPDDNDATNMKIPEELYQRVGMFNNMFARYIVESADYSLEFANWGDADLCVGATIAVGNAQLNPNDSIQGIDFGLIADLSTSFKNKTADELKTYPLTTWKVLKAPIRHNLKNNSAVNHMEIRKVTLKVHVPILKLMNGLTQKMAGADADLDSHGAAYGTSPNAPSANALHLWVWVAPLNYNLTDYNATSVESDDRHNKLMLGSWGTDALTTVDRWTSQCGVKPSVDVHVRLYDPIRTKPATDGIDLFTAT